MTENVYRIPVEMRLNRQTGVFLSEFFDGYFVTGVSANTWEEYMGLLDSISLDDNLVVSPELITATGNLTEALLQRNLIEERVNHFLEFSKNRPSVSFLLGTPLFVTGSRPRNSALMIRGGDIIGVTSKRAGVSKEENDLFEMMPEEKPFLVPGTKTAVLICADMPTATIFSRCQNSDDRNRILTLSGRQNLIGKNAKFLPDSATSLIVMSCWGVGSQMKIPASEEDEYYEMQLRNVAWSLMSTTPITEVVTIDRLPDDRSGFIGPYNGFVKKK